MADHEFAVWAPRPERVRLDVDGTLHAMTRSDDGWWRAVVDARPDARYGFVNGVGGAMQNNCSMILGEV